MADPTTSFEEHRRLLLGLAYRMLGSMWDAEDVVQEAYLRWLAADRSAVRDVRPFLITVVTRITLDHLRSARVRRETYPGPWLPEPVATEDLGPLDTAELRETVAYGTLHLLQRLSPPERAVFVLREAFDLPYPRIAEIVGASVNNCRQMHFRARRHLDDGRGRFEPSTGQHRELLERFLEAARDGDLTTLTTLLAEEVVAWNDGGGRVRAALRPVIGRDNVLPFLAGLMSRYPLTEAHLVSANGELAARTTIGGQTQVVAFDVRNGRIHGIYSVLNPEKLTRVPDRPPPDRTVPV